MPLSSPIVDLLVTGFSSIRRFIRINQAHPSLLTRQPMAKELDLPVSSPAYSLYKFIHTSIRGQLAQFIIDAGKTDYSDAREVDELHISLLKIQSFLLGHAAREEEHIKPILKIKLFPNMKNLDREHKLADKKLEVLVSEIRLYKETYTSLSSLEQEKQGYRFYLNCAIFLTFYCNHMNTEEQEIMPFLRSVLTPNEIITVYMAMVASISDKEVVETIPAIFPYIDFPQQVKTIKMLHTECISYFEDILLEIKKCLEADVCRALLKHIE